MKQKIKLIQVSTTPEAFIYFAQGQLKYLVSKGFDLTIVCPDSLELREIVFREGVDFIPISMNRDISLMKDVQSFFRLLYIFLMKRPDIVHGSTPKAGLLSMVAARVAFISRRLYFLRGLRFKGCSGLKWFVVKMTEFIACKCSSQVIATSKSVMAEAIKSGIIKRERVKVLHYGTGNGIDCKRFHPKLRNSIDASILRNELQIENEATVIMFLGRVVREKGIVELLNAWKIIKDRIGNVKLLIVGPLEEEFPLDNDTVRLLHSDEDIITTGRVKNPQLYYAIADIFVLPSHREGIPIAALEASAMELPVVVTNITGSVDAVIDGVTGTIVELFDSYSMIKAIDMYISDPLLRKTHGKAGRSLVLERYSPEIIWEKLYLEYLRLCGLERETFEN